MSKHRKHRGSAVAATEPRPAADQRQPTSHATNVPNTPFARIAWRLAAVLALSVVLGFAFNTSSPVGVRFNENNPDALSSVRRPVDPLPFPPLAAAAETNRLVVIPPPTSPPEKPKPIPATPQIHTHTRVITPASNSAPSLTTPPVSHPATAPAVGAELNPAPIHWAQAKPLVESRQAVLVDVRHKGMYDAGHIPGAVSLPEASSPDEFSAFLNQHATNLTLIVYCSSVSCSQSARVAGRLVTQFQRPSVKFMTGGYLEYQQAEMAKAPSPPGPTP